MGVWVRMNKLPPTSFSFNSARNLLVGRYLRHGKGSVAPPTGWTHNLIRILIQTPEARVADGMGGPWNGCIQNSPWMRNSNLCPVRFARSPLQMINVYFVQAQSGGRGQKRNKNRIPFELSFLSGTLFEYDLEEWEGGSFLRAV